MKIIYSLIITFILFGCDNNIQSVPLGNNRIYFECDSKINNGEIHDKLGGPEIYLEMEKNTFYDRSNVNAASIRIKDQEEEKYSKMYFHSVTWSEDSISLETLSYLGGISYSAYMMSALSNNLDGARKGLKPLDPNYDQWVPTEKHLAQFQLSRMSGTLCSDSGLSNNNLSNRWWGCKRLDHEKGVALMTAWDKKYQEKQDDAERKEKQIEEVKKKEVMDKRKF